MLYKDGRVYTGLRKEFEGLFLVLETTYQNGLKHGTEKRWHVNGVQTQERFYTKGVKTGLHKGWWPSGSEKFSYQFNDHGEHHGKLIEWYENGDTFQRFNYVNGKEEGAQKMWKSDGRIRANYVVKDGERYGLIGLKRCYTLEKDRKNGKDE